MTEKISTKIKKVWYGCWFIVCIILGPIDVCLYFNAVVPIMKSTALLWHYWFIGLLIIACAYDIVWVLYKIGSWFVKEK